MSVYISLQTFVRLTIIKGPTLEISCLSAAFFLRWAMFQRNLLDFGATIKHPRVSRYDGYKGTKRTKRSLDGLALDGCNGIIVHDRHGPNGLLNLSRETKKGWSLLLRLSFLLAYEDIQELG